MNTSSEEGFPEDRLGGRMSGIAKPLTDGGGSEDSQHQDAKTFLEDLKSHRNSPLEVRKSSNRIIEENEDDSSSDAQQQQESLR